MTPAYEFSQDWFTNHIPVWDKLLAQLAPEKVLEIGSYEGRSACYLIERIAASRDLELHCVDSWGGGFEHEKSVMQFVEQRFDKNVALAQGAAAKKVSLHKHKTTSVAALSELIFFGQGGKFDLVYVDGSHQAPDVLADCVLAFRLLRSGGLMILDDYLWSTSAPQIVDPLLTPKPAIDAFLNLYQRQMRLLGDLPLNQLYAAKL
jgi:predicted O-methyltransferase YrrM